MTKKRFLTALLGLAIIPMLLSCQKPIISDLPEDINKPEGGFGTATSAKRGIAFNTSTPNWATRVVNLKSNWYYNWGLSNAGSPKNVEFVPMFWGHTSVTKANCDLVNQMYAEGKCFYVLGFNEPDLAAESNMSVSLALDDWEFLCKNLDSRIKLVSPAPSYPSRQWLVDFMAGCASRNLRVDYVAVHIYAGIGTSIYETAIRDVYNKFSKQVWITEFAPRDDNASKNGYNSYTMDPQVLDFMKVVVPKYELMPEVFRYAWFSPGSASVSPPSMLGLISSQLTPNDGLTLTVLGDYYKTIVPNTAIALP